MKRVAVYLRVSTTTQTTENQKRELEAIAAKSGWNIVAFYEDFGISGAKGKHQRPSFKKLMDDATRRKFDIIAAWSIDRLGRSLQDLVVFLNEVNALGIDLYLHQQAIDTSTPAGKLIFHVCSVFAEFERSIISERVISGLERAKAQGKQLGRPKINDKARETVISLLKEGFGMLKTAQIAGVGTGTVQKIKSEMTYASC